MLIAVITGIALVANFLFVWPQAWRLIRSRNIDGVSPGTWTISITLFSVWSAYAYATQYWPLMAANISCLIAAILVIVTGTRLGWDKKWAALSIAGVLSAILLGFILPVVLAAVMTIAGIVLRIPQLLSLLKSPDVSGVSGTTWLLSGLTALSWLVVSISRGATGVIIANSTALLATLVLLGVLYWRKSTQHSVVNPEEV